MGWPLVHNASLCKDIGYYYEEFNYKQGGEKVVEAFKNHTSNLDNYIIKNRKAIDQYLTTNKELQNRYIKLISELFVQSPSLEKNNIHLEIGELPSPIIKNL